MSARAGHAAPSTGPELPGLDLVRSLGRGGSAEVFLYNQSSPRMPVAVKVLFAERLSPLARHQFSLEADAMAALGDHPYIVQVFRSGVTADDRPYLVMRYYPNPNLAERARTERLSVAEVLQIGVRIACAVETAHRAGILHRDIKPHNILTSQYGEPGLTDFGIAANVATADEAQAEGLSIPWAAPEVVYGNSPGDRATDVYSLGATLWTALVGRSPFEVPGGDNSYMAMMRRIHGERPPRTGRQDVPAALELLLAQAMAKSPGDRPPSALQFARSLQVIEAELGWAQTPLALLADTSAVATEPADRSGTAGSDGGVAGGAAESGAVAHATPGLGGSPPSPLRPPPPGLLGTDDELKTRRRPAQVTFSDHAARGSRDALTPPLAPVAPAPHPSSPAARFPGASSTADLDGDRTIRRPNTPSSPASTGGMGGVGGAAANAAGRGDEQVSGPTAETSRGRKRRGTAVAAGVAVVVVLAGVAAVTLGGHRHVRQQGTAPPVTSPAPTLALAPAPPVVNVVALAGGRARFSWSEPDPRAGEDFAWRLVGQSAWHPASTNSVVLSVSNKDKTCVEVEVGVDDNVEVTQSQPACTS